jgi:hypothetical protein
LSFSTSAREAVKPRSGALHAESALAPEVAGSVPSTPTSTKLGSLVDNTAFFEKVRCKRRILCGGENAGSSWNWGGSDSFNKVLMRAYNFFRFTRRFWS